ncbi:MULTISPECIES: arginase family protein [Microbacterium]|uniref:arginase family protein n=1 Tax=Microbacterium TaxID=33882 RepID=UPI002782B742|nr:MULTISPECIES: arginase family protein [Microbacterium]MDQ1083354.1 arginase [Microbacterium sp. SORGH_AS_0344]MDQ1171366.1 arginase [Microbacterium proteolyticum]
MTRFIVAPQWQGSSSSRAMQLIDGAEAIAGDLPRASTTVLEAPVEAGDAQGTGVHRLSALVRMRARIEEAVRAAAEPAIVVGGDCGVALGAVSAVAGDDLAVVWIDAHADLNTPASSPSGAFHGMVLRAIAGDGEPLHRLEPGIPPARLVLAGTRALDAEEQRFIDDNGVRVIAPADLADPDVLADAVAATGASRVHVHVDLDVLDPSEMKGVALPEPFGARTVDVVASIRRLRERVPLSGATLTEFSPASPAAAVDDLGTILRLIGALA